MAVLVTEEQMSQIEAALFRDAVARARRDSPLMDQLAERAAADAPMLAGLRRLWEEIEPGDYRYEVVDERGFEPLRARLVSDDPEIHSRPLSPAELRLAAAALNYVTHLLRTPVL